MKKLSIVLNVILISAITFFIINRKNQRELAQNIESNAAYYESKKVSTLKEALQLEAANAREAEAKAVVAITQVEELRLELDKCLGK